MDFSKFSDDNFDLKDWINGAFRAQKDSSNQNTEQFVATLITKLQVFIQEINNSVDETSQQTIQNFPRILREIEVLKQESFMLKEQMKSAREDIIKVEKNTVESMKMLLDLDNIKTNMSIASNALQEADNWTTLTSDLDSVFETNDVDKITNRIQGMQQSLKILQDDSPDYMNRCVLLETYKNKFESLLSSDIVVSFNSKSIELAKRYVNIFDKIDRINELKKYYHHCQKVKLNEKLSQLLSTSDNVGKLLKEWFDYLVEIWHNEVQWCKQVFYDPYLIVMNLINDSFVDFNKKYQLSLDVILEKEANCLDLLVNLKEESDKFFLTIQSNLENSNQLKFDHLNEFLSKLLHHIYEPYKKCIKSYTKLETARLHSELETIKIDNSDIVECVQLLNLSVPKVMNKSQLAITRCVRLTSCCGIAMLIDAFKAYFKQYINEFKRVTNTLKERHLKTLSANEDWDLFRHFLKIIQTFGEFILQYEQLEDELVKKINSNFINISSLVQQRGQDGTGVTNNSGETSEKSVVNTRLLPVNVKDYLLDESDRIKLNTLISNIEAGDDFNLMPELKRFIFSLSEQVHKYAFDIVFSPIKCLLHGLAKSSIWAANDQLTNSAVNQHNLPLFSLAPQEYITKIGQYLLTLPQNFEPFTMQDSAQLVIALKNGKLPYLEEKDLSSHINACWLDSISNATVNVYCEEILKIQQIAPNSVRQLIIDIEYICNVFEDVGLKDYLHLQQILELLKVPKENFSDTCKNKPARIVSAVRNMRGV